ncbi:hypothetical protein [Acidithiobacillus sp.]|uniref:hypothetical protein n=1 Tax=Acidithiobacillus sp. TaxID=1872118 RepID=UPI0025BF457B|nr:hypothetical protein [Acidithiobacillus sp.]
MKPRKPAPEQPDLLADIAKLSQFPTRKKRQSHKFEGPLNPREVRALSAMLKRPITREELDTIAGASNGPELVNQLRDRGLELPCFRLGSYDMDGIWIFRGLYLLTQKDRAQVAKALTKKKADSAKSTHTASEATEESDGGRHG